ncbi:Aldo/keto reductase [Exidia glandulosa HHB12029]|uniref:Aldo/keto reductase n=1 Tax=Exidia glandulosa HHB12029 TaxID=1314781 RepID=A0A165ZVS5_EXIGL|nr:Aldo/keto reductase [Exidia glandulosa HHB12029]
MQGNRRIQLRYQKIQRLIDDSECTIVPAANQIELHPCLPQTELVAYCQSQGILVTAYSSLGQPGGQLFSGAIIPDVFFSNQKFKAIAAKHNATVAQVLLSWAVAKGINVIPKSESEERLRANATIIELDAEDTAFVDRCRSRRRRKSFHRLLATYQEGFVDRQENA